MPDRYSQRITKNRANPPSIWWAWLAGYTFSDASRDLLAGVTAGIMLVPQSMAYAMLAGLPPIYGLYASLVPLVVYALLGSSRHLSIGATAIESLIMAFAISALAEPASDRYIAIALMFTLMVGMVHLFLWAGRLGFLVNLLSRPVILGFISAAAAIIGFSQLGNLMGVPAPRTEHVYDMLLEATIRLPDTHFLSLGLGLGGIALLVLLRKWKKLFPSALIVVLLGMLGTWGFDLHERGVAVVGDIPTGLPGFAIPVIDFNLASSLFVTALTVAMIQFTNVVSLGKSFAARFDYSINANRELFAIGMANVVGSFFQSFIVSGSFSRTAINADAGARSPLSNLFSALLVALVLLVLTPFLYYLPVPILGAIIMVAAFGMINFREMRNLYRMKRLDGGLALLTFVATLVFGLQAGILFGVIASVVAIMYRISRPNVAILGNLAGTRSYRDVYMFDEARLIEGILILRVDASFMYANADFLKDLILYRCDLEDSGIHSVIIDASSVNDLDTTAVGALFTIVDRLHERHIHLYITGVHGAVRGVLKRSGLQDHLGKDSLFLSPHRAVQHIQRSRGRTWIDDEDAVEDAAV